jgi:hypothetical protein
MKYKVGDKVKVKSLNWFNESKLRGHSCDYVVGKDGRFFSDAMAEYCGQEATIAEIVCVHPESGDYYRINIDDCRFHWDDWMFEDSTIDLVEILKDAPIDTELYSTAHGIVKLISVLKCGENYPIGTKHENGMIYWFTADGKSLDDSNAETILFPSKENRDWSTFEIPRWRAKKDFNYYYISVLGEVCGGTDDRSSFDDDIWKMGNYFETKEEAKNSKFYKVFHEKE